MVNCICIEINFGEIEKSSVTAEINSDSNVNYNYTIMLIVNYTTFENVNVYKQH